MEWTPLFLVGTFVGAAIAYIWLKKRLSILEQSKSEAEQSSAMSKEFQKKAEEEKEQLKNELKKSEEITQDYIKSNAENDFLKERLEEEKLRQKKLFEDHKNDFKQLAQEIAQRSSEQLSKESLNSMHRVVGPLKEHLDQLKNSQEKNLERHAELKEHIKELHKQSLSLGQEAQALTHALKGSKVQGDFGEQLLEILLEQSGLKKNMHYSVQEHFRTSEGNALRPDVLIKMPDQRALIIDSKVSLNSYQAYINNEDPKEQESIEKSYLTSIRRHIDELKRKDYGRLPSEKGYHSLDYVLMFMPIEAAFLLAMDKDKSLFNQAMKPPSVLLVSPTTLMSTLRIVSYMWRQSDQQKHAQEIAAIGGALYDKLASFLSSIDNIGKNLEQAQSSYQEAHKRLSSDRKGELGELASRIKTLGAAPKKELPPAYQMPTNTESPPKEELPPAYQMSTSTESPPKEESTSLGQVSLEKAIYEKDQTQEPS